MEINPNVFRQDRHAELVTYPFKSMLQCAMLIVMEVNILIFHIYISDGGKIQKAENKEIIGNLKEEKNIK